MGGFPAVTVLAQLNALLLLAIVLAPLARRMRIRSLRRLRVIAHPDKPPTHRQPLATQQPVAINESELCAILTHLDRQARNALLASLDRRAQPAHPDVLSLATDRRAADRISAIRLLGTTCDVQAQHTLARLLADADPEIRRVTASASAWSARVGYPHSLDAALVDRLLHALEHEQAEPVLKAVIDALAYSLDPRVPAALLRRIPASRDAIREHLVESGALFAHLAQSAERRRMKEGVAAR
jgi:hypothetical protein